MKKVLILVYLLSIGSLYLLQAQDKQKVVHIKKYNQNYYFSVESEEGEEVEAKKSPALGIDEQFVLEIVNADKWMDECYIKTFEGNYVTIEDGTLMLTGTEKPDQRFHIYNEGEFYRIYHDGKTGLDINLEGELLADGSSAGFFELVEVEGGIESLANFHMGSPDVEYSIKVATADGVFTETSSQIEIKVYYSYTMAGSQDKRYATRIIDKGDIGKYGNREASVSFTIAGYVYKVEITNKGGGINETWKVDSASLLMYRNGSWQKMETTLLGYWVNKGASFTIQL
jgi:hypothetical protein